MKSYLSGHACTLMCALVIGLESAVVCPLPAGETTAALKQSGNPIFPGWYADPEAKVFGKEYWVYPTYSAPYNQQILFDAFSSPDLVHWIKHPHIFGTNEIAWAHRAMWAPAVAEDNG